MEKKSKTTKNISKKTRKAQQEALKFARKVQGRGLLERIAQVVVNRAFEAELEVKIAELRKVIVQ